jgi:transcriptional regulator GlxA family with amidase domain
MQAESDKAAPAEIGIVLYPGAQLAAVHGLTDLFAIAGRLAAPGGLRTTHWQLDPDAGTMACAFDTAPAREPRPDALIVPPTLVDLPPPEVMAAIARWLATRHAGGAALASVCSGAFLLAETGLLSGRLASTHWSCAEGLGDRFPDIRIETGSRVIDHGDVITAGGFMAWVDLGLRLVERILGGLVRAETARFLLVDAGPAASPAGFMPIVSHGDAAILRTQDWLHQRDARDVSLAAMAAEARLEKRTFLRRFAKATGMTPLEYCQRLRVARALELLQASRKSSHEIAWAVGYADAGAFARVFRKFTGVSPAAYRQQAATRRQAAA